MRPAFKFEECRTPRSTGTKKDEEKREREAYSGGGRPRGRNTLSGVNSDGKRATRGRIRGRRKRKRTTRNTRTTEKEEAPPPKERRKMNETKERLVSDNTAENAREGDRRRKEKRQLHEGRRGARGSLSIKGERRRKKGWKKRRARGREERALS